MDFTTFIRAKKNQANRKRNSVQLEHVFFVCVPSTFLVMMMLIRFYEQQQQKNPQLNFFATFFLLFDCFKMCSEKISI